MRFALYLKEEYIDTLHGIRHDYMVFKNPTPVELGKLRKDIKIVYNDESYGVRGLVDISNKDIYIIPAKADLHSNVYDKLSKQNVHLPRANLLSFVGYIEGGKIYGESMESFTGDTINKKVKFDWLKRYVHNVDTIDIDELSSYVSFG